MATAQTGNIPAQFDFILGFGRIWPMQVDNPLGKMSLIRKASAYVRPFLTKGRGA